MRAMSGKEIVKDLVNDLMDTRNWLNPDRPLKPVGQCTEELNALIKHYNLEVIKDATYTR